MSEYADKLREQASMLRQRADQMDEQASNADRHEDPKGRQLVKRYIVCIDPTTEKEYADVIVLDLQNSEVVARYISDTILGTKRERAESRAAFLNTAREDRL
jgi:K+-sensing histidine kinase KdpD